MFNFKPFAAAFAKQWDSMSANELFRTDVGGDELVELYLASFPEGTNPIFRVRTEHDGSYDRNVIRRIGNVVSIKNGELTSVWDIQGLEFPYDVVAKALSTRVKAAAVNSLFRMNDRKLGHVETYEHINGEVLTWNHFHASIADRHFDRSVGETIGAFNTTVAIFKRGLEEFTAVALETALDLIDSNSVYRGKEFRKGVAEFQKVKLAYDTMSAREKNTYLWNNASFPFARMRNSAVGTFLTDLSEGKMSIETAVEVFGKKTDPTNYKRPTAIITKGMVDQATKTIHELGLESALERRHAKLADVNVNDVLWTSGAARTVMKGGVAGLLEAEVTQRPSKDKAENVSAADFFATVLPQASTLEVLVKNSMQKNLMSITAPVHDDVEPLFKWPNNFGWSYNGNITDAIKERVKAAGGKVDADIRVSLAWYNFDDLDLHCLCPYGHIYFGNKSGTTGRSILDVDMNAGGGTSRTPVENLAFNNPADGHYTVEVNQYSLREKSGEGFTLELEFDGEVHSFSFDQGVANRTTVQALRFHVKNGKVERFEVLDSRLKHSGRSEQIWGLQTETFVPVTTVMNSPNHWGESETGNKHWFFLLEGCFNDAPARGIYNEFLRSELSTLGKTFEVLGAKTMVQPTSEQLSGVGFSETQPQAVTVRVTGQKLNKTYNVQF